ncbi:MAG: NADH:ubiquinone oxidoreductase [bacterium]
MNPKPKIAFFDFTCCEGCQLQVINLEQELPDVLDKVDIVYFREAMTEKNETYEIAFVEGSCTRLAEVERLKRIRSQAKQVLALGTCAHIAGVNAIKNRFGMGENLDLVYGEHARYFDTIPARPISAVIPIDGAVPGCPIHKEEFKRILIDLLQGHKPSLPNYPVCVECKMNENVCLFHKGQTCLGPITRAGCDSWCPNFGSPCEGCRGLIDDPNLEAAVTVLTEAGHKPDDIRSDFMMFLNYEVVEQLEKEALRNV